MTRLSLSTLLTVALTLPGCLLVNDKGEGDEGSDDTSIIGHDSGGDADTDTDSDTDADSDTDTDTDSDTDTDTDTDVDDLDGDGYTADEGDCDDTDDSIHPDAREICDGVDNDCDGDTDEDGATTWYQDSDGDGYGSDDRTVEDCEQPRGYVEDGGDCDDRDDTVYPDAEELCDGVDNDCDGSVDEGATSGTWYADADGDGYGDPDSSMDSCESPGTGYVSNDDDCDDATSSTYPGADEYCDSIDNDCDGTADEDAVDGAEFAADADGDGFGDPVNTVFACAPIVDNTYDCDDTNPHEPQVVDTTSTATRPDGSLGNAWRTVQEGIDNSLMCVIVYPGTYTENIDFGGMDLEVFSSDGFGSTTLHAPSSGGSVVTFQSGETSAAELRGFTISGGTGTLETSESTSSCGSGSTCTTTYERYYGGGVFIDGAAPTLKGLWISGNSLPPYEYQDLGDDDKYTYSYGGGVFVNNSTGTTLEAVNVGYNLADAGGGVYAGDAATVTMKQSRVLYNVAATGGGIAVAGGIVDVTNGIVVGNTGSTEGGGLWIEDGTSTWWNVTGAGNGGTSGGTAAVMGTSEFFLYNSIIAYTTTGAGVYVESGAHLDVQYTDAASNTGGSYSGVGDPTGTSGNIDDDPSFTTWSNNATDDDDFTLSAASALVDAGNPSTTYNDVDGTTNDIGAYGGPGGGW